MAKDSHKKQEANQAKANAEVETPHEASQKDIKKTTGNEEAEQMSTPLLVGIVAALLVLCGVGVWLLLRDAALSSEPPVLPAQPDDMSEAATPAPSDSDQTTPPGPTVAERQEQIDTLHDRRNPHNLTLAERRAQINNLGN